MSTKMIKPVLCLTVASFFAYAGCSDDEKAPARTFGDDGGGSTTDSGGSTSSDSGGTVTPESGTGSDASTTPKDSGVTPPPKDATTDAPKDAKTDAPTDAAVVLDAATVAADCASYCSCMTTNCSAQTLADGGPTLPASCQATCVANYSTWNVACRTTHCGLAGTAAAADSGTEVTLHCGHGAGASVCL